MKKICTLLVLCSLGLFTIGCEKKKDATAPSSTSTASSTGTGGASTTATPDKNGK